MSNFFTYIKGDKVIWIVVIIFSAFSVLAVYSSTGILMFQKKGAYPGYFFIKHTAIILAGFFIMYLVHLIKFKHFSRIAVFLYFISVILLFYTLFFGTEINEARRWIEIQALNLTFQPSDIAKVSLILYVSRIFGMKNIDFNDTKTVFFSLFLPVFIIIGLIAPADNSTAGLLLIVCFLLMFFGGLSVKILARIAGYSTLGIILLFGILTLVKPDFTRIETFKSRINNMFTEVESGSHQEQLLIAVANGRFLGKMPGQSMQKYILPLPYSDSIYAFFVEEYGLIGGMLIILLFLILLFRGIRISIRAPEIFSSMTALGITLLLVTQAFIHILVTLNFFPITGMPLPFLSMGGTSILLTFFSLGILLSISNETDINQNE